MVQKKTKFIHYFKNKINTLLIASDYLISQDFLS